MFPLGTALVPHQLLPLQVFEPRYHALVRRCLETDRQFGVVLIERGAEVGGGDVRFDVGTLARILELTELPDDRIGLVARGESRLRVRSWLPDDPYPHAEVEVIEDPSPEPELRALRVPLAAEFARLVELARALGASVPEDLVLDPDPTRAGWEAIAIAPVSPIDAVAILGEDDPAARLGRITTAVADAADLLELQRRAT